VIFPFHDESRVLTRSASPSFSPATAPSIRVASPCRRRFGHPGLGNPVVLPRHWMPSSAASPTS